MQRRRRVANGCKKGKGWIIISGAGKGERLKWSRKAGKGKRLKEEQEGWHKEEAGKRERLEVSRRG